jgi:hypothetical protein
MEPETPAGPGRPATGVDEQIEGTGDEGRRAADVSPPIADGAEDERTQAPAEPGDVGVPPDGEMNQPDEQPP